MTENQSHKNPIGQDTLAPTTTKYHSGFVSGLQVLLWPYREQVEIDPEKWLSKEGIRMDILLLKKDPDLEIPFDTCRLFRGHNIFEYKRPNDQLTVDVFAKVMAYAHLYKSKSIPADAISYRDITATIYRQAFPREMIRNLMDLGATIESAFPLNQVDARPVPGCYVTVITACL